MSFLSLHPSALTQPEDFCPATGSEVLNDYGVSSLTIWQNILILLALTFGFCTIAYIILRRNGPRFASNL